MRICYLEDKYRFFYSIQNDEVDGRKEESRLPTNSVEKPSLTKEAILRLAQCIWAYLYTQIYLLARVRKVFEQLFIHWSIRSYRKRGFCTVSYTQHLRLSTFIDLCTVQSMFTCVCVCIYFQMSTMCCTKVHIQNSSKMQRATTNQPTVRFKYENTVHWTKLKMTIVYLNNALHFQVRIFVRIQDLWCEYILFFSLSLYLYLSLHGIIRMTIDLGNILHGKIMLFGEWISQLLNHSLYSSVDHSNFREKKNEFINSWIFGTGFPSVWLRTIWLMSNS